MKKHRPIRPNPRLLALWKSLKPDQKQLFAKLAKTTIQNLRQYVEGRRHIHPDLAIRVERASAGVGVVLDRTELSDVCRRCDYARIARKTLKGLT